jgi:hypothetical protein
MMDRRAFMIGGVVTLAAPLAAAAQKVRIGVLSQGFPDPAPGLPLLASFSGSVAEQYRRAALLIDKILKGARPADLPVEQPTKFGETLGLAIPPSLLARADQVIE